MYRTDDLLHDFVRHQDEMDRKLEERPRCDICNEYIQEDFLYEINDELICENCLNEQFRKQTEFFMEYRDEDRKNDL